LKDYGNLDTRLVALRARAPEDSTECDEWVDRITTLPGVERIEAADGTVSLRVNGLEFARQSRQELFFGLETKHLARASNLSEIEALARELIRVRSSDAADRQHRLYSKFPERWLESQVRRSLSEIDAGLLPKPVYGQVPAFAGGDRSVIDLLAADGSGRLAVIEIKASEDVHLPLQALDYWMRVKWHVDRDEFSMNGYFPGRALTRRAPRLMLVAPSLSFHSTTETVVGYLSPLVPVERIGLGMDWQSGLKVVFRAQGADSPD
ncbi:MAG: hypothetical protein ACRD7E_19545, partial [Bryobacteraceae bacterium]